MHYVLFFSIISFFSIVILISSLCELMARSFMAECSTSDSGTDGHIRLCLFSPLLWTSELSHSLTPVYKAAMERHSHNFAKAYILMFLVRKMAVLYCNCVFKVWKASTHFSKGLFCLYSYRHPVRPRSPGASLILERSARNLSHCGFSLWF